MKIAEKVLQAIKSVVGNGPVRLHEPQFLGNEKLFLEECIDSTFVSSVGPFVDRFEGELATYTGSKYAVAVVNGTSALHTSLLLAGVRSGDEVLVPALSFVATANAVCYCGAVPHFIDSDDATLGVNAVSLREHLAQAAERRDECCINKRTGRVIRAIVPMHTFGHPVDIEGVLSVAKDYGLVVVEDAAESLGSFYETKHTGTFGLIGALSFNGNKIITTGGGGAILTGDADLAALAKHVTTTAKLPHHWDYVHDRVAFNYRMPNINAALGCAQLEGLPCFLTSKRRLFERYRLAFADLPEICVVREPASCTSNYWLQTLLLDKPDEGLRDAILKATNDAGLMTRPAWRLLHKLTPFQNSPKGPVPCAEALEKRIINIPSSPGIV